VAQSLPTSSQCTDWLTLVILLCGKQHQAKIKPKSLVCNILWIASGSCINHLWCMELQEKQTSASFLNNISFFELQCTSVRLHSLLSKVIFICLCPRVRWYKMDWLLKCSNKRLLPPSVKLRSLNAFPDSTFSFYFLRFDISSKMWKLFPRNPARRRRTQEEFLWEEVSTPASWIKSEQRTNRNR
jgi:hypothetical protein